jgi:hypothetical protein
MSSETLSIPEENLEEFIKILENGLRVTKKVSKDTKNALYSWIDEEKEYVARIRKTKT